MLLKVQAVDEQREKLVRMVIEEEYSRMQQEEWISFPCMKDMGGGIDAICKKEQNILNSVYARRI